MQEWINSPVVIDLIMAAIFLAAACAGLVKGFYKQIMPFAVVTLALLGDADDARDGDDLPQDRGGVCQGRRQRVGLCGNVAGCA